MASVEESCLLDTTQLLHSRTQSICSHLNKNLHEIRTVSDSSMDGGYFTRLWLYLTSCCLGWLLEVGGVILLQRCGCWQGCPCAHSGRQQNSRHPKLTFKFDFWSFGFPGGGGGVGERTKKIMTVLQMGCNFEKSRESRGCQK